jgi:hypothetical protein
MVRGWLSSDSQPFGVSISPTSARQIQKIDSFSDSAGEILYYVVYLEPDGFLIVAGDDDVEPIICFVQTGTFDPSDSNPLGALVSSDLPARILIAKGLRTKTLSIPDVNIQSRAIEAKARWNTFSSAADSVGTLEVTSISDVRVGPLVVSLWGQANIEGYINYPACYNYYTGPYGNGDNRNYPCGCVATATAQLMRYHQHPGSFTWSNMPLEPDLSTTEAQRQAIGQLCYDIAVEIKTDFGPDSSEAFIGDASAKLKSAYSYSNSILSHLPTIGTTFNNMVNTNLDGARPVLLALRKSGTTNGHAVVCDGYGYNGTTLYHHLNMGWDGQDNAWYNLPTVDAYYDYDIIDYCVYNVYITGTGEIISGRVTNKTGNPIPNATVSATAAGTGTFQATTNSKGIYALVNLPSSKTYTVSAVKSPYVFTSKNATTGQSMDNLTFSGNEWAIDFASTTNGPPIAYDQSINVISGTSTIIILQAVDDGQPSPPAAIRYIITALPTHCRLVDPAAGVIKTTPYELAGNTVEYESCGYYAGPDSIGFVANDYGTAPTGGDSNPATSSINISNVLNTTFALTDNVVSNWPLYTSYQQSRTQVIYLAANIGTAMKITDIAINIDQAPGQALNNWTIRMKHTNKTQYPSSPNFEPTGWTVVYQNNESPTPIGWRNFHMQTPFEYNGTSNLLVDFSFNNSSSSTNGKCKVSDTGINRVLMSYANGTHGDPLTWSDVYNPGLWGSTAIPNIKLTGLVPAKPLAGDFEPDCDVDVDDLQVLAAAWLSGTGDPAFDVKCDIYKPADGIIDFRDLATLAYKWLTDAF